MKHIMDQGKHVCAFIRKDKILNQFISNRTKWGRFKQKCKKSCLISERIGRQCFIIHSNANYEYAIETHLARHYYMIHPYSNFCFAWDFLMAVVITLSITVRPFIAAFLPQTYLTLQYHILSTVIFDVTSFFAFILKFFTGYEEENDGVKEIILESKKVVHHVLIYRGLLAMDFFFCIPFELILFVYKPFQICLRYFSFLHMFRMHLLITYLIHVKKLLGRSRVWDVYIISFVAVLITIHWIVCFEFLILVDMYELTWMTELRKKAHDICGLYFPLFYTVTSIVFNSSMGFQRNNPHLQLLSSILLMSSYFGFAILISYIFFHLSTFHSSLFKYDDFIETIKHYAKYKELPKPLERKLVSYFQYKLRKTYYREKMILLTLSNPLRLDILRYTCSKLLKNCEVLSNLPSVVVNSLLPHLQADVYMPNEVIIEASKTAEKIYFISSGSVALHTLSGKEIIHLEDGQSFGEDMFSRPDNRYLFTVVAVEASEIYKLSYKDYFKVIQKYSHLAAKIEAEARRRRSAMVDELEGRIDFRINQSLSN